MANFKEVYFRTLAFAGVSWLVLLAGVADMQRACGGANYTTAGTAGYLGTVPCDVLFGYAWWIVFLQAAVLAMCAVAGAGDELGSWKVSLVGLLATATVLVMDTVNTFLQFNHYPGLEHLSAPRAAVAGGILTVMTNFFLLVAVGRQQEGVIIPTVADPEHAAEEERAAAKVARERAQAPAGAR